MVHERATCPGRHQLQKLRASVLICTHDRPQPLERLLHSLANQTVPAQWFEIVVVDDGPAKEAREICDGLRQQVRNLRYIPIESSYRVSIARNAGLKEVAGDRILMIDDDCEAASNWIENMLQALRNHPLVAGAVDVPPGRYLRLCHHVAEFHRFIPCMRAEPVDWIANANAGYHRWLLEELGKFNENLPLAADMDFVLRARARGYRPYFEPDAVVQHHAVHRSFEDILHYSHTHAATTIRLRLDRPDLTDTPSFFFRPYLLLLSAPCVALAATAGIFLRSAGMATLLHTAPVVYILKAAWCVGAAGALLNESSNRTHS